MGGAPEDEVGAAQLLQVPQALELRRIKDLARYRVQPEVPMHRVIEDLQLANDGSPHMLAWAGSYYCLKTLMVPAESSSTVNVARACYITQLLNGCHLATLTGLGAIIVIRPQTSAGLVGHPLGHRDLGEVPILLHPRRTALTHWCQPGAGR